MTSGIEIEWSGKHAAFLAVPKAPKHPHKPTEMRLRAIRAIDAGGVDGATMADVCKALCSAHLPAFLINKVVDRLVDDGHVRRVREATGGRPRVRLWSYRNVAPEHSLDMAHTGVWAPQDYTRLRWAGKSRETLIIEVLRSVEIGKMLDVRAIEGTAGQIYIDADRHLSRVLFENDRGKYMTKGQMRRMLMGMVRNRLIMSNDEGDEFCSWR